MLVNPLRLMPRLFPALLFFALFVWLVPKPLFATDPTGDESDAEDRAR